MAEAVANRQISGAVAATARSLKISEEQAAISGAATTLDKTGRLLLPNGKEIDATELRVVGGAKNKQAALDELMAKKGYPGGAIKLKDFALFCDDLSGCKKGSSFAVKPEQLKTLQTEGAYGLAPAITAPAPKPSSPALPKPTTGGATTLNAAPQAIQYQPPSQETKDAALAILKKGTLNYADQKKLLDLASTMIPANAANDPRAAVGSLTALLRVMKPKVDADDARSAAKTIADNVATWSTTRSHCPPYQLVDTVHDELAPQTFAMPSGKQPNVATADGAEAIVAANGDARKDEWTPSMIRATPYAFALACTQIDGDKASVDDQTTCGPMSLVGAIALRDPDKLADLADTLLDAKAFPIGQQAPYKAALERIKDGTFTPADANLMARAMYADVTGKTGSTSGVTDDQLINLCKRLSLAGFSFPTGFELHLYGANEGGMGHYNAFAGKNFDPWPGVDGKSVIQSQDDATKRHNDEGRKLASKIIFDKDGMVAETIDPPSSKRTAW